MTERTIKSMGMYAYTALFLVCATVIGGWYFDIEYLRSVIPGLIAMNPFTAIGFLICGFIIFSKVHLRSTHKKIYIILLVVCSAMLIFLGVNVLAGYIVGYNFGLDQLFFNEKLGVNRIAPNTAINFICIGIAFLFQESKRVWKNRPCYYLFGFVILTSVLGIIAYIYNSFQYFTIFSTVIMALNTSVAFLVVALGFLVTDIDKIFLRLMGDTSPGMSYARRFSLPALLVPIAIGYVTVLGERASIFPAEFAEAIIIVATIFFLLISIIYFSRIINTDERRRMDLVVSTNLSLEKKQTELESRLHDLQIARNAADTVLKELEIEKRELQTANAKYESLISSIGDGVVAIDTDGSVLVFNIQAQKMLGWKAEEVIGKKWANFIVVEDESRTIISPQKIPTALVLATGKKQRADNYFFVKKNKTRFPVGVSAAPVLRDGAMIGAIVVFRDITREKEIDAAKTEFVTLSSHQLRTPLTAINWYVELLLNGKAGIMTNKQLDFLREIARSSKRMVDLIGALLNVSRIELDTFFAEPISDSINDAVESIIDEQMPMIKKKRLSIEKRYAKNIPYIKIDRKIMSIIFGNLLSNAIKYTSKYGKLRVIILRRASFVELQIIDSGCGIPPEVQSKVFSKFFRAENARMIDADGFGLGLYIAQSVARYAGCRIWFKSPITKVGRGLGRGPGTAFMVSIPLTGMKGKKRPQSLENLSEALPAQLLGNEQEKS